MKIFYYYHPEEQCYYLVKAENTREALTRILKKSAYSYDLNTTHIPTESEVYELTFDNDNVIELT